MIPGAAEYISLRLMRRFLFSSAYLVRFGRFVPYYQTNTNQSDPGPVVDIYESAILRAGLPLAADRNILEIGAGATNSVGYELLRRGFAGQKGRVYLYEPNVAFDRAADAGIRARFEDRSSARVERCSTLEPMTERSIDLVLSNSVLEHVIDMDGLLIALERVLDPAGRMIHAIDYRDHFFKYPYHFLVFQAEVWERWLNPGDLPRWRLSGHLKALSARGYHSDVLDSRTLPEAFEKIKTSISKDFDFHDPTLAITSAVILSTRQVGGIDGERAQ